MGDSPGTRGGGGAGDADLEWGSTSGGGAVDGGGGISISARCGLLYRKILMKTRPPAQRRPSAPSALQTGFHQTTWSQCVAATPGERLRLAQTGFHCHGTKLLVLAAHALHHEVKRLGVGELRINRRQDYRKRLQRGQRVLHRQESKKKVQQENNDEVARGHDRNQEGRSAQTVSKREPESPS
jgi:hypothetical protein